MPKATILVVADDCFAARGLQRTLQRAGYDVPFVAASGMDAIARAEESDPDLVVLDIDLKDKLGGLQAADHIRRRRPVPIVCLTADGGAAVVGRPPTTAPIACLLKPFEEHALLTTIEAALPPALAARGQPGEAAPESAELYRLLVEGVQEYAIYGLDLQGNVVSWNPGAERLKGYTAPEIIGQHFSRFYPEEDLRGGKLEGLLKLAAEQVQVNDEGWQVRKDGSRFWASATITALRDRDGGLRGFAEITRDLTERQNAERERLQVNRALCALSACNQALMRAADESGLLHSLCRAIVETGGYRLAWVGYAEQDEEHTVRPVAHAGYEAGYLETLKLTWADTPRGRGPAGAAIRTGKPVIARDILIDPHFEPWRAEALRRGYASTLALPLAVEERTLGALCIYAKDVDAFHTEEVKLLTELAGDLAYGIAALRTRLARRQAEAEAQALSAKLEAALASMSDAVFISDTEGRLLDFNQAFATFHKFRTKAECAQTLAEYPAILEVYQANGEPAPLDQWAVPRALRGETGVEVEYGLRRKDTGETWAGSFNFAPLRDRKGAIVGSVVVGRDITERKRVEKMQEAIYKISQAAVSTMNLEELYRAMHDCLGELISLENSYIALYDAADDRLSFPYFVDHYDQPSPPHRPGRGLTEYVLRTGRPLLAPPEVFDQLLQQGEVELVGTNSVDWLGVPLKLGERVIGVLVTQSYTEGIRFSQKDLELLEIVSTHVATAIERKQAEQALRVSEKKYRDIVENTMAGVHQITSGGPGHP